MRSGRSGSATLSPMPRRSAAASCCSTADSMVPRRSSGRRSRSARPESSLDSSRRFWASQSSRSSCVADEAEELGPRRGIDAGRALEQLDERAHGRDGGAQLVADVGEEVAAPVAVARMMPTLSSSRSAIWLNWVESVRSSSVPDERSSVATREARSPSARRRDTSVRRVMGTLNRWARNAATSTAIRNAAAAITSSSPLIAAIVVARLVNGSLSVAWIPQSRCVFARPADAVAGRIAESGCWPRSGSILVSAWNESDGSGSGTSVPSGSCTAGPNEISTLASATSSATVCSSPASRSSTLTAGLSRTSPVARSTHTTGWSSPTARAMNSTRISAVASARSWSRVSSCWRKNSSSLNTRTGATSVSVSATTAMNANVSRVWNDWGTGPRLRASPVRTCGGTASAPGRRSPQRSANWYPAPRTVRTNWGRDGSSSILSRRWLTCTLIVFSSWSRAS